ncbi:hypothetical protein AOCH_006195 [Aspergillus ochraceoroseus]|uniref:Uncharacterized protein n=1 Tax=Aspergillus ochraceoroseus TaxID=138278 RepID=A0A0F8X604_9EURO|nr:hypothetical protein AOCH_006195 [Aspergillus ochraceoroseus]
MADGLPGHEHDFYRIVKDNPWLGGDQEYSDLNEAFTYWLNGLVPLAYLTDDGRLKQQVLDSVDYILSHQQSDGWLGPETEPTSRNFWARYPLLLGLEQLAEAEEGTDMGMQILDSMHRFIDLTDEMLSDNYTGYVTHPDDNFDDQWGRARAADMIVALQWLYEHDPRAQEQKLLKCMKLFYERAFNWTEWYDMPYIQQDLDTISDDITVPNFAFEHGVNVGQGLKAGAVFGRLTRDKQLSTSALTAIDLTFTYHGTPSGVIIGDERLSGLSPVRGVELCTVVETMFSLSYIYHTLGENSVADRCELAAYNALPVMTLPDWWAHQYVAQTNQPTSKNLSAAPFWSVGTDGQMYGLEPNYPCCTVNHPQGYPKFVSASFVRDGDNGIAHALLGPTSVDTTMNAGVSVHISCDTKYPFAHELLYNVQAGGSFEFSIRVPKWSTQTEISVNGNPLHSISPDAYTGMQRISLEGGESQIHVSLSAEIKVEPRANDTVSMYHGALLYAAPILYDLTSSQVPGYEDAPPQVLNHEMSPTTSWAYAIDPRTARFQGLDESSSLPNPLWTDGAPTSITVRACEIDWVFVDGYAPNPPPKEHRTCLGDPFDLDLVPYGSAKLHMAELPVIRVTMAKRTLESFYKPVTAPKKAKIEESTPPTRHPSYPHPIANLSAAIVNPLANINLTSHARRKGISHRPHLDLLYFQPFIPPPVAQDLFIFLRQELPFYRVQYTIRRGSTDTQIVTPRFTTVFGVDATSQFIPSFAAPDPDLTSSSTLVDSRSHQRVSPSKYQSAPRPIPECLDTLRRRAEAAIGDGATFNFCLVNYYASGDDSISYHSDDERFLGPDPCIASLSLGAPRDFLIKHKPPGPSVESGSDIDRTPSQVLAGLGRYDCYARPDAGQLAT